MRYPWQEVKQALHDLARVTAPGEATQLAYVNPETGQECMPTLGFSAIMLRPGEELTMPRRSPSGVLKVVEGRGQASIDGREFNWDQHDIMAVPTHSPIILRNSSSQEPAYLFLVDDAPLHRKLGFYEVFD